MNKINGYTEEEAKNLVEYIKNGKQKGKTLTYLFETYGIQHGRAKGSVRNYYYALMKNERGDERIVKLLDGSELSVEKIREFTEEECVCGFSPEMVIALKTAKEEGGYTVHEIYGVLVDYVYVVDSASSLYDSYIDILGRMEELSMVEFVDGEPDEE